MLIRLLPTTCPIYSDLIQKSISTPAGVLFIRYAEEAIVSLADFENITVWGETLRTEGSNSHYGKLL